MQVVIGISLLACGINFQYRMRQLADRPASPPTASDQARTAIEKEADIDELRTRALYVLHAENNTWRAYMAHFRQLGAAVWSGFFICVGLCVMTCFTIYALRLEKRGV